MKRILVFASEIQHFFVLIDLLYFGVSSLLISFMFYICNNIKYVILLQVFCFLFIFSVLSAALRAADFNVLMLSD